MLLEENLDKGEDELSGHGDSGEGNTRSVCRAVSRLGLFRSFFRSFFRCYIG